MKYLQKESKLDTLLIENIINNISGKLSNRIGKSLSYELSKITIRNGIFFKIYKEVNVKIHQVFTFR